MKPVRSLIILLALTFSGCTPTIVTATPLPELTKTATSSLSSTTVLIHREDKSIFVLTGQIPQVVNEAVDPKTLASGPTVEVMVTTQTKIYRDVTSKQFNGPPSSGQKPQQEVEPGSLEEIGESSILTVWGRRTGDRLIADMLVYTNPTLDADPE